MELSTPPLRRSVKKEWTSSAVASEGQNILQWIILGLLKNTSSLTPWSVVTLTDEVYAKELIPAHTFICLRLSPHHYYYSYPSHILILQSSSSDASSSSSVLIFSSDVFWFRKQPFPATITSFLCWCCCAKLWQFPSIFVSFSPRSSVQKGSLSLLPPWRDAWPTHGTTSSSRRGVDGLSRFHIISRYLWLTRE